MTGLVGWWPLHENSGTKAYDLSGNENHGSLNGGIVQGVAGKGGLTSYSFDGSDDYIGGFDTGSLETEGSHTIAGWYKTSDIGDKQPLIKISGGLSVTINNTSSGYTSNVFQVGTPGGSIEYDTSKSDDGSWHHFVAVYDDLNGEVRLYIDNDFKTSKSISYSGNNISEVKIGALTGSPSYPKWYGGRIQDLRFYNRALSPQEVQELYECGNGDYARPLNDSNSSSAVSRWAFDGDVTDSWSGNGGSVNGATFIDDSIRGQALSFDGNDNVDIQEANLLGDSIYTLAFWYKTGFDLSGSTNYYMFSSSGGSDDKLAIYFNSSDLQVYTSDSSNVTFGGDNFIAKEWGHISLIFDSNNDEIILFHNGVHIETKSISFVNETETDLYVGYDGVGNDEYYQGKLDDVRIYDKALSPSEVFELYRWGTRGRDLRKQLVNQR